MTIFEKQGGIMGLFPFIFALIVGLTGPRNVKVLDKPNDDGSAVIIEWDSASVTPAVKMISIYQIARELNISGSFFYHPASRWKYLTLSLKRLLRLAMNS